MIFRTKKRDYICSHWRNGRVVECGGLENRWGSHLRGFESLFLRKRKPSAFALGFFMRQTKVYFMFESWKNQILSARKLVSMLAQDIHKGSRSNLAFSAKGNPQLSLWVFVNGTLAGFGSLTPEAQCPKALSFLMFHLFMVIFMRISTNILTTHWQSGVHTIDNCNPICFVSHGSNIFCHLVYRDFFGVQQ